MLGTPPGSGYPTSGWASGWLACAALQAESRDPATLRRTVGMDWQLADPGQAGRGSCDRRVRTARHRRPHRPPPTVYKAGIGPAGPRHKDPRPLTPGPPGKRSRPGTRAHLPPVGRAGRCQRLHAHWRRHIARTEERPMAVSFQLVIDCADPEPLARFWAAALGYELEPPPDGFASWHAYWRDVGVPEDELGTGADCIVDPDGRGPRIWFQVVPDRKAAKNRLHLDIGVSGGRAGPIETRRERVAAEAG